MIMLDKKKALETIMSKRNPQTGEVSSAPMAAQVSKSEEGEPDGRHAAAQDVIAAMNARDPQKLMEAMGNFHDLHAAKGSNPDKDDDSTAAESAE